MRKRILFVFSPKKTVRFLCVILLLSNGSDLSITADLIGHQASQ